MWSKSFSVARPGGGQARTRRGWTPPRCLSNSARFSKRTAVRAISVLAWTGGRIISPFALSEQERSLGARAGERYPEGIDSVHLIPRDRADHGRALHLHHPPVDQDLQQ